MDFGASLREKLDEAAGSAAPNIYVPEPCRGWIDDFFDDLEATEGATTATRRLGVATSPTRKAVWLRLIVASPTIQQRWSRPVRQLGGLAKVDPGCFYAAMGFLEIANRNRDATILQPA